MTLRAAIRRVALDALRPAASNVKTHDVDLVAASIARFGFADPLVVDQRTGDLLAGHGRLQACVRLRELVEAGEVDPRTGVAYTVPDGVTQGWEVPVYVGWSSRDDAEADAARIALNRTTEVGGWDDAALLALLDELSATGPLDGVGFADDEIDLLRSRLDGLQAGGAPDPWAEWEGMPSYDNEDLTSFSSVRVHFATAEDLAAFAALIGQDVRATTRSIWYPEAEIGRMSDRRFVSDGS